jgi:hypothetical protein
MALTLREAYKLAGRNATGLIEAMDLEQLFGGDEELHDNEDMLTKAQAKLVTFMKHKFPEEA